QGWVEPVSACLFNVSYTVVLPHPKVSAILLYESPFLRQIIIAPRCSIVVVVARSETFDNPLYNAYGQRTTMLHTR
ncbi:1929_t:CDS:2, partial [Funneliformis mosseae]